MKNKRENVIKCLQKQQQKAMIEYCVSSENDVKCEHCLQQFSSLFELYKIGFDDIEINGSSK